MSKFQTKMGFSIMLFVILFFVLTNAVSNGLKRRQLSQGSKCTGETDDANCDTFICRVKDKDSFKCQLTDTREEGDKCLIDDACKSGLTCLVKQCQRLYTFNPTATPKL
ncbi:hypothetical protein C2G38_2074367 [Gigaspora rosea]|uniref:Extracellular membrane protein CFEM domain-containing protein n=1 Tax=Gigaspora rosea TaxID=44941 RepID=A0A397VLN1_9GLOM|nr:hypothetical protein C2G38_2074367 [Gigaspora rosea]